MATNNEALPPKPGGNGGGELEKRMTAVEARLGVIEKTMVTAEVFQRELGAVRGEIGGLRHEMRVEIGGLRHEMRVEIGALRDEMRVEIGGVRVDIAKIPFELVKWLMALAGIAVAIATTVYNLWFR